MLSVSSSYFDPQRTLADSSVRRCEFGGDGVGPHSADRSSQKVRFQFPLSQLKFQSAAHEQ
jgi:hypothetical protein